MKILKYKKKKNNLYLIELDNGKNLELYEEVILSNELLIKREVDATMINKLLSENSFYECYYKALSFIKSRLRSIKETKDKLIKLGFSEENVSAVIDKLIIQGYLNDSFYASSYLNNQLITTYHGPNKIRNDLRKKGVDYKIIESVLEDFDLSKEEEKVTKIVTRMIKSNSNKSNNFLKNKICSKLLNEGYDKGVIDKVFNNTKFSNDDEIRKKEYEKIKKRLSKKYSGYELDMKIKEAMYRKGFY